MIKVKVEGLKKTWHVGGERLIHSIYKGMGHDFHRLG